MGDKVTHSLTCTEMELHQHSLVPLTSYWSLNEITIQNKHSHYHLLPVGWHVNEIDNKCIISYKLFFL